ncbi:MAG: penicillin-binding protein activator [Gallionellaceae bacterium]
MSVPANASTEPASLPEAPASAVPAASGVPSITNVRSVEITPVEPVLTITVPVPENPGPHIALLLPLKSKSSELVLAADAVLQGFSAAADVQRGIQVRLYSSEDEAKEVVALFRQAHANGAIGVVGPLTRNGVAALANYPDIRIPTLALNLIEPTAYSTRMYFFGLSVENEARQVAQNALHANLYHATIISTGSAFSKRLSGAFTDEWKNRGGSITAEVIFNKNYEILGNLPMAPWPKGTQPKPEPQLSPDGEVIELSRPLPPPVAPGNMVFLATDHDTARLIRPYLNPSLPVYATSQLFKNNTLKLANFDLNDIHFVDMPWLVEPDHPAVMSYPRAAKQLDANVDRLYALGIDAYRLMYVLLTNRLETALPLDGVTGTIQLHSQQFLREPKPAFFQQGMGLTKATLAALNAAKAAEKLQGNFPDAASGVPSTAK